MTFRQLCENTSSYELTQWMAFYKIKTERQEAEEKRLKAEQKAGSHTTTSDTQKFSFDNFEERLER